MDLVINSKLIIPSKEIRWRFSRSSGAGGQNVNKIESRVEIIFDIKNSEVLTEFQKSRLLSQLSKKINYGCFSLIVQKKRTQYENRKLAISKLTTILKNELRPLTKIRKETKPTKSSQKRRVESKKKRGALKQKRQSLFKQDY